MHTSGYKFHLLDLGVMIDDMDDNSSVQMIDFLKFSCLDSCEMATSMNERLRFPSISCSLTGGESARIYNFIRFPYDIFSRRMQR